MYKTETIADHFLERVKINNVKEHKYFYRVMNNRVEEHQIEDFTDKYIVTKSNNTNYKYLHLSYGAFNQSGFFAPKLILST